MSWYVFKCAYITSSMEVQQQSQALILPVNYAMRVVVGGVHTPLVSHVRMGDIFDAVCNLKRHKRTKNDIKRHKMTYIRKR